jgi:hypothetical protein
LRDFRDEPARQRKLVHPRQRMGAGRVEQRHFVVVAAERILRPVGDDERQLLAAALFLGYARSLWLLGRGQMARQIHGIVK